MAERTVGTNTLIDGEKIDAIELNGEGNIDVTSIGSGNVTDNEFEQLTTLKNDLNNAASGMSPDAEEPREVTDINEPIGSVVTDDGSKLITVTFADGTKKIYSETGIKEIDSEGNILSDTSKVGTYTAGVIEYTDGSVTNELGSGELKFRDGTIAYKNADNVFTGYNKFNQTTLFGGSAITLLDDLQGTGVNRRLDGLKGNQGKLGMSTNTNIIFDNMIHGGVYTLFLVISGGAQPKFFAKKFNGLSTPSSSINTYWPDGIKPTFVDGVYVVSGITGDTAIHLSAFGPTQNVDDSPAFT